MKCVECSCCHKGWFQSKPDDYVCIGVAEPFVIQNINAECTEYPNKRNEEIIMNTAEMWIKAQKDGNIYECIDGDMAYSCNMGLVDKFDFNKPWGLEAWEYKKANGIDDLMSCEWKKMDNLMTIEEAEEKFNIRIIRN